MAFAYGFAANGKIFGVDVSLKHTTQQHAIGTESIDSKGRTWVYVKANGTIGAFKFCKAASSSDPYTNVVIGTASAAATLVAGMTVIALAAGDYAWIVKRGTIEDDATVVSANLTNGQPIVCDANGAADLAAATDIENAIGICVVDDTDNTGTIFLY